MWTISALKERARERKKTNRWKMILVALILTIAAGTNVSLNYGLDWLTDTTDGQETVYEVSPGEDVYGPDIVIGILSIILPHFCSLYYLSNSFAFSRFS